MLINSASPAHFFNKVNVSRNTSVIKSHNTDSVHFGENQKEKGYNDIVWGKWKDFEENTAPTERTSFDVEADYENYWGVNDGSSEPFGVEYKDINVVEAENQPSNTASKKIFTVSGQMRGVEGWKE